MLRIPRSFSEAIVHHALAEAPLEACGFLAGRDGEITKMYPLTNEKRSPVLYRADSKEMFTAIRDMEESGIEWMAIYHSHTRSAAYPSATDVEQAYYPECVYLIVSLADRDAPNLRGFRIRDGKIAEEELEIVD